MAGSAQIIEVTAETFQQVVVDGSHQTPVLVDFWAPWCAPCKTLMPLLDKIAEDYQGAFVLAKVNTEEQQAIAGKFGIRSIPTVKLFKDGDAIDEFAGALPEGEIRSFLDKHLPRESDALINQAQQHLLAGDSTQAMQVLKQAVDMDPSNPRVQFAIAQTQAAAGDAVAANAALDALPKDQQGSPDVVRLRGLLYFDVITSDAPDSDVLEQQLKGKGGNSEAMFQLAAWKVIDQNYEGALELLIRLMRTDAGYQDDAARKTIIRIFEILGADPLVKQYRLKMASLLH